MKRHTKTPFELRMWSFYIKGQKIKGKGHTALISKNRFWHIIALPFLLQSLTYKPDESDNALSVIRSQIKGQSYNAVITENSYGT